MSKLFLLNTITNYKDIIFDPFGVPFAEANPDIEVFNIVDDSLLSETIASGGVTPAVLRRMYNYTMSAIDKGANCVMGTCTSVNVAAKHIRAFCDIPVINIDEPVAKEAVAHGGKIGVLATLPSSPGAIIRLIKECAKEEGKELDITTKIVSGAFDILCAGDRPKHDSMVNTALLNLAKEVDIVVFAQISMSLVPHDPVDVPLLKIGTSGFEYAKELIKKTQ